MRGSWSAERVAAVEDGTPCVGEDAVAVAVVTRRNSGARTSLGGHGTFAAVAIRNEKETTVSRHKWASDMAGIATLLWSLCGRPFEDKTVG